MLKNVLGEPASKPFYIWANEDCSNSSQAFEEAKQIRHELRAAGADQVYICDASGTEVVDDQIVEEESAEAVRSVADDVLERGKKYGFTVDQDGVREAVEESASLLHINLEEALIVRTCDLVLEEQAKEA